MIKPLKWLLITSSFLLFLPSTYYAQTTDEEALLEVEQKLTGMSLDEKIGQLFMIRAHSNLTEEHVTEVKSYIKDYHVGGLCFFQGTPKKQAELTNKYQAIAKIPLLISVDAEWGIGMRFKEDALTFPKQMTLGAIQNDNLIYQMGRHIGDQMKNLGMYLNFAPVVDVNNNPLNPVINERSFGENPERVLSKSYHYMMGLKDAGTLACAKHFPGHGDTDKDSHLDLPVITHDRARLDSIELYPFQGLINQNVDAIMSAHLSVTGLDDGKNRPASLSSIILTDVLINEMGFNGLIITDAMEMEGVAKFFPNGVADVEAFLAGNDIILLPKNLPKSFSEMKKAVESGKISKAKLDNSVRKILVAKQKVNILNSVDKIVISKLDNELYKNENIALKEDLIEASMTLVKDDKNLVPVTTIMNRKISVVHLGETQESAFQKRVDFYVHAKHFNVGNGNLSSIMSKLKDQDLVIIAVSNMAKSNGVYKMVKMDQEALKMISDKTKTIICHFGNPYGLDNYNSINASVLCAYNNDDLTQDITAQSLFGVSDITGTLPVSSGVFHAGTGIKRAGLARLGVGVPEGEGLNADTLAKIKGIVDEMIKEEAAPGCRVLIAKGGKIIYDEAFGYYTYEKKQKVDKNTIYDLASVTKILATTSGLMALQDQGEFGLYDPLYKYFDGEELGNKKNMITQDILAHHSGLPGWIAFYVATMIEEEKKSVVDPSLYRNAQSDSFSLLVADDLYLQSTYQDTIWSRLVDCKLRSNRNYRYSDLGMYIFRGLIERQTGLPFTDYLDAKYYKPMGLYSMGFNPLNRFPKDRMAPTEKDDYYRNQVLQGHVHDMGAAMLNGVSGHAGLFSDAYDVAKMMQMFLNGGQYGGKQYIAPSTIATYTKRYFRSSRRGMGFDMKETVKSKRQNMSEKAPPSTFGHLGFTGIATFDDPDNEIVFVFLSNRTFPTMKNNKFSKHNYRPRVQSVIYDALIKD